MAVHTKKLPDTTLEELFNYLPMVVFYSKDREGVFTRCNLHFEEMHGLPLGGGVGLTDFDLHSPEIASSYRAEDCRVMESGAPISNQTWIVPDANGVLRWWISSKLPLCDEAGAVCGVAGVMYEISRIGGIMEPFARLAPALELMHADSAVPLGTERMAAACHFSASQFNRIFRQTMGQSPQQYLVRHRLEIAKRLLAQTDLPLSEIAMRVGFYDASVLGKKFRELEGVTPRGYRLRLRELIRGGQ